MIHLTPSNTRLIIRPAHVKTESLRGYISRVSSQNGSSPILNNMLFSLKVTTDAIQEISTLTGCSDSILKEHGSLTLSRNNQPTGVRFGNCTLSTDQVWVQRRMVCPQCLSNDGISSCYWELRDYDVCHKHGCYLVRRCSDCDRPLNWEKAISGKCSCGIKFENIKTETASINRGLICNIIADEMTKSLIRSNQCENDSESLAPLNWLFIICNFIISVLIPIFCQEHLGKICAINKKTREELLLTVLKDKDYYDHLHHFISLHSFRNQMTMTKALRAGIYNNKMRHSFLSHYKKAPIHNHFFKIKSDFLKITEFNLQKK